VRGSEPSLNIRESLSYLLSSKYLGLLAILVLSYGITSNIIDLTWKNQIKLYLKNSNDYFLFMSRFSFWTGITTIAFILITKGIVRRFGWFYAAFVTPVILFCTGILFFSFVIFKDMLNFLSLIFGVTSIYITVMVGAAQSIFIKGAKYSLFDPTKEMAYIPLDQELKVKGKAAVDVIGGRLGKSIGSFIESILLTITGGTQLTIAPYLFGVMVVVVIFWGGAVKKLSILYKARCEDSSDLEPLCAVEQR